MSPNSNLTSVHEQVLSLIASGSTVTAAAAAAGVHRNTIGNWMHSPVFRRALAQAQYDKAISWREQAESLASAALDTIRAILTDGSAPAAVRLKAALSILDRATTPPPPPPGDLQVPAAQDVPEPVHKNAQQSTTAPAPRPQPSAPTAPHPPESVHKNAQLPPQAQRPRNAPCPCGSGRKFKRCCLGKSPAPAVCEAKPIPPKQAP